MRDYVSVTLQIECVSGGSGDALSGRFSSLKSPPRKRTAPHYSSRIKDHARIADAQRGRSGGSGCFTSSIADKLKSINNDCNIAHGAKLANGGGSARSIARKQGPPPPLLINRIAPHRRRPSCIAAPRRSFGSPGPTTRKHRRHRGRLLISRALVQHHRRRRDIGIRLPFSAD